MHSLKNKTVFITGAGGGIGRECAIAFADAGAEVILTDISAEAVAALATELSAKGTRCHHFALDVADANAYAQLSESIIESIGCPDILINNAGIGFIGNIANTTTDIWQRTLDINLMGVVNGCKAFASPMQQSGKKAHIVNVSSMSTKSVMPNLSAYVASKYAVEGFSEVLAMELHDSQITVTCVHPAVINTAIVHHEKMVAEHISTEQIDRLQHYYQTKGCAPSVVAEDILNAVIKDTAVLYTGPMAVFTALLYRLLPKTLLRRLMLKMAKEVGYA